MRGLGGRLHLTATLFLLVSLFAPAVAMSAAAAPASPAQPEVVDLFQGGGGDPPPLPAPVQAGLEGDLQGGLNEHRGIFSAALPVPPGSYDFRIVVIGVDGQQRSLGEDGDPDGDDLEVDVPDGAVGVYISYDYRTGEIVAEPIAERVTIQGGFGTFDAAPIGGGNYELYFSTQAGTYNLQVFVNDQPVGVPAPINLDFNARVHVVVDNVGNILTLETVPQAGLTVVKTDESGTELFFGSCIGLFDGDDLAVQACDVDDGEDGSTFLLFINGIPGGGGTFTVRETFVPEGQQAAEEVEVSLGNGEFNDIQIIVPSDGEDGGDGEDGEDGGDGEDGEDGGDGEAGGASVILVAVDESQTQVLPGACYQPEDGEEVCDGDDGAEDGFTTLSDLDEGDQIEVTETEAPEGYESAGSFAVQVSNGSQFGVPHEESEVEGPSDDELGTVVIEARDENGDLVPGGCYAGQNEIGQYGPECDGDDGPEDGRVEFTNLGAGLQQIFEVSAPPGYTNTGDTQTRVELDPGETETVVFDYQGEGDIGVQGDEPGEITIEAVDDDGDLIPAGCYTISNSAGTFPTDDPAGFCDNDEDGRIILTEVPTGDNTIAEVSPPDDYVSAGETVQTIQIEPGESETVTFFYASEEEPPVEDELGTVVVEARDESGALIPGGCYAGQNEIGPYGPECDGDDGPEDGQVEFTNLGPGDQAISQVSAPPGYVLVGDAQQNVEIDGGETETVVFIYQAEDGAPPEDDTPGTLTIFFRDEADAPVSGVTVEISNSDGPIDQFEDEGGQLSFSDVPPGEYTIEVVETPDGVQVAGETQQTIEVDPGEDEVVTFLFQIEGGPGPEEEPGNLTIRAEDENGDPIPAGCYTVTNAGGTFPTDDPAGFCDNDGNGEITLTQVIPGDNTVTQVAPPPGEFGAAETTEQTVNIAPGEDETVTFVYPAEEPAGPATLAILIRDTADQQIPTGGAEYRLSNEQGEIDTYIDENGDGQVFFDDIPPGIYTIEEISPPEGYTNTGETSQTVEIEPGEAERVTFVYEQAAPETGTLRYIRTDDEGEPVEGACILLEGQETFGPICDNDEGDTDDDPGEIEVEDLPPDSYLVSEETTPEGVEPPQPDFATVDPGETATFEAATAELPPPAADLVVVVSDGAGNPVPETCFELLDVESGDVLVPEACDGDDDGRVGFIGIPVGTYVLRQTVEADGFAPAGEQQVEVPEGGAQVDVVNPPLPPETGDLEITRRDPSGEAAGGGCYEVVDDEGETVAEGCDNDENDADEDEGEIDFAEVPEGDVTVNETQPPAGLLPAEPQIASIDPDVPAEVELVSELALVSLTMAAEDEAGDPVLLVCYQIDNPAGSFGPFCDDENGTGDGQVTVDVYPGENTISVVTTPTSFATPDPQTIPVNPGEPASVTFTFALAIGSIQIAKFDGEGSVLGGACFDVIDGQGNTLLTVCDNGQGDTNPADGEILIENVPAGDYEVVESQAPVGFTPAASQPVTVVDGPPASLTFVNLPSGGTVEIVKQDENGGPLEGAGFMLDGDQDYGPIVDNDEDDADDTVGVIRFENVAPGIYTPVETEAPVGYEPVEAIAPIEVTAGEVETVTVVNAPPAPATGSVQILKTGEGNQPLGGAAFTLDGEQDYGPIADNGAGDADPAEGTILINGVLPGTYTVIESTVPTGYQAPEAIDPVTVVAGQTATVPVTNEIEVEETGGLEITKVDAETGELLGGACFGLSGPSEVAPVCDNAPADGNPAPGVILITKLPAGTYSPTETQAPPGYIAAPIPDVEVTAGEQPTALTVENSATPPPVGSVLVRTVDPDQNAVADACYRLTGADGAIQELCDGAPNDPMTEIGQVRFDGVVEGEATVEELTPPPDHEPADPASQTVPVVADETAEVVFSNVPVPEDATGGLLLELQDQDGDPTTTEEPFYLRRAEGSEEVQLGPFQDNGEGDGDDRPGYVLLEGIPVGTWTVYQPQPEPPAGEAFAATSLPDFNEKTVTVQANVIIVVIIIIIIIQPEDGDVLVTKRDSDTNQRIGGSCFRLESVDDPPTAYGVCDNDFIDVDVVDPTLTPLSDSDGTVGRLRFDDLPLGTYTVIEIVVPAGYDGGANTEVEVEAGLLKSITVYNDPIEDPVGDLIVYKVDENHDPLEDSCFELWNAAYTVLLVAEVCDEDDGDNDGEIHFDDVAAQQYLLRESQAPPDYAPGANRLVTVIANDTVEITVVNTLLFGTVIIEKRAETDDGPYLFDACFRLEGENGAPDYAEICDDDDGLADGKTTFIGIEPGDYTAIETETPLGYADDDPQDFTVDPSEIVILVFVNQELPPPPDTGNGTVYKVDGHGNPLPGACFTLRQGAVTVAGPICDSSDGSSDGVIHFVDVGTGVYTLREVKKPSADYQTAPDREWEIEADETVEITVENELRTGRILIKKTNKHGQPLQGACFDVSPDGKGQACTNASGEVVFDGLTPGTYKITETVAPNGYFPAPVIYGVVVEPGATTQVTVVDQPRPPAPDTGSIQVIKFYCPAGKGGEFTQILDSSNPGGAQLAQTAGCTVGDATFSLTRVGGEGGPGTISTGADGTYQTTLPAGTYRITETSPQLGNPSTRTEQLVISKNQQTTIVVINYVKPPEPAPVDIVVIKYTCDPGYAGTHYADFLANCGDPSQLTNGVTYRISGQAIGKGVTGDVGEKGVTGFFDVPAGQYTLKEEKPPHTTVYVWCGLDVNNPTLSAVSNQIGFTLQPGQRISCVFFNVPAEVTDTTGSILVHKYTCPVQVPPAGYDFEANCRPQQFSVQFSLALYNGETRRYEPKTTGGTNANGLLQFTRLQPGTYQLTEIGSDWCFAESNSVNAVGDVIVRPNQQAEVWIYNCNPTKGPPNTGAGTAALALAPSFGGSNGAAALALGLVWPLLAFAGWRLRRPRRRAA